MKGAGIIHNIHLTQIHFFNRFKKLYTGGIKTNELIILITHKMNSKNINTKHKILYQLIQVQKLYY